MTVAMVDGVLTLMRCIGRLTPPRRALVNRAYAEAREAGKGDGESSAIALALLTEAERGTSEAQPLDAPGKAVRPRSRATG